MTANFPDYIKAFRIFPDYCQFSGLFQNCPDFSRWLPIFRIKDIHYAFFGNVVRGKSTLLSLVVRNGLAHFVRKVFARRKLLPGKFWVFAPLRMGTWHSSKQDCESLNGSLAAITSIEIHNFLMTKVDKENRLTWY